MLLHFGRKSQAALTALAFMLASLLGVIHEATTTHVRCAEHGELIHATPTTGVATTPTDDTVARDLVSTDRHGDDHCVIASAVRESRVVSRAPAIAPIVAAVGDLVVAAPRVLFPPVTSLYRTAPKTSPPV